MIGRCGKLGASVVHKLSIVLEVWFGFDLGYGIWVWVWGLGSGFVSSNGSAVVAHKYSMSLRHV